MKKVLFFVVGLIVMWALTFGAMWISSTQDYLPQESIYVSHEFDRDEIILFNLLDYWGEELDDYYNSANIEECPWERGNWLDDVASEMDWQYVAGYIIAMPSFGGDDDYEILDIIIDGRFDEIIPYN